MIKHDLPFNDYCRGMSLKDIASKHGTSLSTVKKWSSAEKWNIEKKKVHKKKRVAITNKTTELEILVYDKFAERAENCIGNVLKSTEIVSSMLLDYQKKLVKGEPATCDLDKIEKMTKISNMISGTIKSVLPQFPEEIADRLLKEMSKEIEDG